MGYQDYVDRERAAMAKANVAHAIQGGVDKLSQLREARVKADREAITFDLDTRLAKAKLAAEENNPMADPALVSAQKRNLKLGLDVQQAQMDKANHMIDSEYRQTHGQVQQLGQVAGAMNRATAQNPDAWGGMLINPNLKTGQVTLMSMKTDKQATVNPWREEGYKAIAYKNELAALTDQFSGGSAGGVPKTGPDRIAYNRAIERLNQKYHPQPDSNQSGDQGYNQSENQQSLVKFDKATQDQIKADAEYYGRSEEEVIDAMRKKGILNV